MDPVKRSLISLHLTVMLLGGTALFSQLIPLSASAITLGRSLFAFLALFLFMQIKRESLRLDSTKDYSIALLLGVLMSAHWVTYFAAMQYAGVSVGIIALFTFPMISVLLEPFFEGTRLNWKDVLSALTVLVGIGLIVPDASIDNDITLGVAVGVFSALLYAFRNLLHRKHFSHHSGAKAMSWQTLIIAITLVPFCTLELTSAETYDWLMILVLGTIFTALPHAMIAASLAHLRVKTFSLIACMQPFYGVVLAIFVLHETPTLGTLIGGILITSAAIVETLNTHNNKSS